MKYKRLNFISTLINKDEKVLDVGTDHALLPIMLISNSITNNITASDVNQEPLNAAITNINSKGYQDIIKTKLMDGISDIREDEFSTIVIAGIGGNTISSIIKEKKHNGRYIIHSTTNLEEVRNTIKEIGHKITNEWVIYEGKIHNVIIESTKGNMDLTDKDIFMGPSLVNKDDEQVINYYQHLYDIFERNASLSGDINLKVKERNWLKEKLWSEKN